ncbi:MAG: SagB/ThcOx family dehydrogenase [Actinomycetia bacterium]|nr:SagB/ThcOx family dehydrogenase [Actinomycetes bacterium]
MDPDTRPPPFKYFEGVELESLPEDFSSSPADAFAALSSETESSSVSRLDSRDLARLLYLSAGVVRTAPRANGGRAFFRAAMSAGNLHPLDIYVALGDVEGMKAGLYHFQPLEFSLVRLDERDVRAPLASASVSEAVASSAASLIVTAIPWRQAWKYGERGWRHLYWDAGTLLANLLGAAKTVGMPSTLLTGFVDADVAELAGVDRNLEFPVAIVAMGHGSRKPVRISGEARGRPRSVLPESTVAFPLTAAAQREGDLQTSADVERWREASERWTLRPIDPIPPSGRTLDEVVRQRGSTRRMRRTTVAATAANSLLKVLQLGTVAEADVTGDILMTHFLSVHGVEGIEPGLYVLGEGELQRRLSGDLRARAQHICHDQRLGGDSAITFFHTVDLERVFERFGARGYRIANLEAGLISGRLALAAFALGYGATSLTFFDDEAGEFLETDDACLLATSVGVPDYRSVPGGHPRAPAELHRYQALVTDLTGATESDRPSDGW